MAGLADLSNKKILVVEDDDMNFVYLTQIFKIMKGNITRAKNGKSAIQLAQKENFDIILMDLKLPDINGIEVTHQIRQFDPHVPIIAQTASRTPDETDDALDAGCNEILVKPYTLNDFSEIISKYVR
jgi:CheY-like chemotaxis protein